MSQGWLGIEFKKFAVKTSMVFASPNNFVHFIIELHKMDFYAPVGVIARGGHRQWGYAPFLLPFFIKNLINHYFGCQIRILRGRSPPTLGIPPYSAPWGMRPWRYAPILRPFLMENLDFE